MESSNNLFAFEQTEASSGVNATFILEEINKELKECLLDKVATSIQQTAFLTS